jgi:hypothetical protein
MAQKGSFAEIKAEQARMTESWKAEGRTSEAWAVADPEIVEIFTAGVVFGLKVGRRNRPDLHTPRTNGAEHCVRLWKKQLPLKSNLKEPHQ